MELFAAEQPGVVVPMQTCIEKVPTFLAEFIMLFMSYHTNGGILPLDRLQQPSSKFLPPIICRLFPTHLIRRCVNYAVETAVLNALRITYSNGISTS